MNEASPIPLCEDSSTADTPQVEAPARPAMRGDLTKGPILKTLLFFSIPMLLSNVLQTLNGSVNAIWVGRLLGERAGGDSQRQHRDVPRLRRRLRLRHGDDGARGPAFRRA
ncbi:hypothetical protein ACFSLT_12040 [Novosphingobium resinovorum]